MSEEKIYKTRKNDSLKIVFLADAIFMGKCLSCVFYFTTARNRIELKVFSLVALEKHLRHKILIISFLVVASI